MWMNALSCPGEEPPHAPCPNFPRLVRYHCGVPQNYEVLTGRGRQADPEVQTGRRSIWRIAVNHESFRSRRFRTTNTCTACELQSGPIVDADVGCVERAPLESRGLAGNETPYLAWSWTAMPITPPPSRHKATRSPPADRRSDTASGAAGRDSERTAPRRSRHGPWRARLQPPATVHESPRTLRGR